MSYKVFKEFLNSGKSVKAYAEEIGMNYNPMLNRVKHGMYLIYNLTKRVDPSLYDKLGGLPSLKTNRAYWVDAIKLYDAKKNKVKEAKNTTTITTPQIHKYNIAFCLEDSSIIETTMPVIPQKGDSIGLWINEEWTICQVEFLVYQFEPDGIYNRVEINIS